ncbi:ABC transporter ATP-binding protein [Neopusillimonas maritima]|uniref:ABC transporter ATP-binding protein n=1 Tax=Neopusillimonas maritima TaxID=2026239 RepID=A0A3A1YVY3_9BURK|nr:ATP-binding cassette domain-containing protein [Neopusillimonas maritima]RIY41706.1 ABC transporter ATP-binding protein [Neopusillimonas maritima]
MVDARFSNADTVVQVCEVRNQFGSHIVHDHLSLDVYQGEILGVVGGSGSGKSVLLRTIVGLQKPRAGQVLLRGNDVYNHSNLKAQTQNSAAMDIETRRCFGVLFQRGALFSSLTVLENIALPLIEHAKLGRDLAEHIAQMKLGLVGLPGHAGQLYPASLSGGMIKRAALARALALDPDILFLDEPTAGLDPIGAGAFDQLIRTLRDALGLTVFLVTHDLDTLYTLCDRVAVISQKKVLVADTLSVVAEVDDAWIQEYFHGPRGRSALAATEQTKGHA